MRQESKCKNCDHPVVFFNGRWSHTDFNLLSDLCIVETCDCRQPEPQSEELDG